MTEWENKLNKEFFELLVVSNENLDFVQDATNIVKRKIKQFADEIEIDAEVTLKETDLSTGKGATKFVWDKITWPVVKNNVEQLLKDRGIDND